MKILLCFILIMFFNLCFEVQAKDWIKTNFDNDKIITCLAVDSNNTLFAGTFIGAYESRDKGFKWYYENEIIRKVNSIRFDNIIVVCNSYYGYFCFNKVIYAFSGGFSLYGKADIINPTSICYNKDTISLVSAIGDKNTGGVQKMDFSLQNGWRPMNTGLPIANDSIKAYDIINKNDTLYVGLSNGLYYSLDDGKQWLPLSQFDGYKVDHFVLNSKNDLLFIVNGTKEKSGVYKNFKRYFNDVLPISAIAVNRNDDVFIGTGIRGRGVFYTNVDGKNWTEYYEGLDSCQITALVVDTSGIVYAGTNEQGIYKRQFSTTGISDAMNKNTSMVFPNPFSDKTRIQYNLELSSNVKLTVFNSLGQQVKVLVNEYQVMGRQEAVFNASELPSGAYYFILQVNNKIQSGRLMVVK